jgi:hypothetical protein
MALLRTVLTGMLPAVTSGQLVDTGSPQAPVTVKET